MMIDELYVCMVYVEVQWIGRVSVRVRIWCTYNYQRRRQETNYKKPRDVQNNAIRIFGVVVLLRVLVHMYIRCCVTCIFDVPAPSTCQSHDWRFPEWRNVKLLPRYKVHLHFFVGQNWQEPDWDLD